MEVEGDDARAGRGGCTRSKPGQEVMGLDSEDTGGHGGRWQLTDGAVGARKARAGAVALVTVLAHAYTDALVLAGVVAAGVHYG